MHPIAFQFGALTITWYGILVASGFLVALWRASRRAPFGGVTPERVLDLGPWLILGAIIGARALYVITFWRTQFANEPLMEIFKIWRGGLVFYGGFIGATLGTVLFAVLKRVPVWKLADIVAPSIPLGYAFGRMGCLLNGCCFGRHCTLPWAIHFPPAVGADAGGVHPTQIYDALWALLLFVVLARLYRRKSFDGQVFAGFLFGYATLRFLSEFTRGDYPADQLFFGGHITPAQIVSLGIFVVAAVLWRLLPRPVPALKPAPEAGDKPKPVETAGRPR